MGAILQRTIKAKNTLDKKEKRKKKNPIKIVGRELDHGNGQPGCNKKKRNELEPMRLKKRGVDPMKKKNNNYWGRGEVRGTKKNGLDEKSVSQLQASELKHNPGATSTG